MSFIAAEGGRTVYNDSKRKLYEIDTLATLDEVQSVGSGEVEKTGRKVTEARTYHVVATSEAMARALFAEQRSPDRFPVVAVTVLFVIDAEIETRHG